MRLILGPGQSLLDALSEASLHHDEGRLRVAVAWAREDGVLWLLDAIGKRLSQIEVVVGVNEQGTTVEALLRLLPAASHVWVYYKHPRQTFHPKFYVFQGGASGKDSYTVFVGSANLTTGGLVTNFEASLRADSASQEDTEAKALMGLVESSWRTFTRTAFAHPIRDASDVEGLYRGGYIVSERTIRAQFRQQPSAGGSSLLLPTAPPQYRPPPKGGALNIPFELTKELPLKDVPPDTEDPAGVQPLPYRFFVRTLTANDIEKLHGRRPGTFEPDLGRNARDTFPSFWGWPEKYREVKRQLSRLEWQAAARLVSRLTAPSGTSVELMLWYREPRLNHLEEHRFRLGPIGSVRSAVPEDFDEESLVIFERAPSGAGYDFVVRLVTTEEPGFADYSTYLAEHRAGHRFGYGPIPGS